MADESPTHASTVADEMMTLSSGRFFMILLGLAKSHATCVLDSLLLEQTQQQICIRSPLVRLIDLHSQLLLYLLLEHRVYSP